MSPNRCPFSCTTCARRCKAAQRHSHRFDCCGLIRAHVPVVLGKKREQTWQDIADPMRAGYLTGPSQTTGSPEPAADAATAAPARNTHTRKHETR